MLNEAKAFFSCLCLTGPDNAFSLGRCALLNAYNHRSASNNVLCSTHKADNKQPCIRTYLEQAARINSPSRTTEFRPQSKFNSHLQSERHRKPSRIFLNINITRNKHDTRDYHNHPRGKRAGSPFHRRFISSSRVKPSSLSSFSNGQLVILRPR